MDSFVKGLEDVFRVHRNKDQAGPMAQYMKNNFEFFGIKSKQRRDLLRGYVRRVGKPDLNTLPVILTDLWKHPKREMQYVGLDLLSRVEKKLPLTFITKIEQLIIHKSWWDTVDALAVISGEILRRYPESIARITDSWIASDNMWLQRSGLIFQLRYKEETNWPMMEDYITRVYLNPEFFIQKACGWALRQYSKTNPEAVKTFVETHELSSVCRREAIKYI
ncbi:MAG: DNA alkylation repair protein [Saprospiraceae bacterium]|nr:DNA alkylation repair protein [Saprospiraceae bacterium]